MAKEGTSQQAAEDAEVQGSRRTPGAAAAVARVRCIASSASADLPARAGSRRRAAWRDQGELVRG